jgi:hypothetical protein
MMTFDATLVDWALGTIANIENAPLFAIQDAVAKATENPRSLRGVRRELEHDNADAWREIKRLHIRELAKTALKGDGRSPIARLHAGLSRQGVQSHLQAILSAGERQNLSELMQLLRSASRVKPLGQDGIHRASLKAIKSRAGGMLAHLRKTTSSARLLGELDRWLGDGAEAREPAFVQRITFGEYEAKLTLCEMHKFAPGDWRWRVLLATIIAGRWTTTSPQ